MPDVTDGELDTLRLDIDASGADKGVVELKVYVNGIEMTSAGAGMGMDPFDVFVPANRLVAAAEPSTAIVARCSCGEYGCANTAVTITRSGEVVQWEWLHKKPIDRNPRFDAAEYDREVARVAADHAWESPERTVRRLVRTTVDRDHLQTYGLRVGWIDTDSRDTEFVSVQMTLDDDYLVWIRVPWFDRSPEQLAAALCAELARSPREWNAEWRAAEWRAAESRKTTPPSIAGVSWRPHRR